MFLERSLHRLQWRKRAGVLKSLVLSSTFPDFVLQPETFMSLILILF